MSKSFGDRKVHAGQIKKAQNAVEEKEKQRLREEAEEAETWKIGAKPVTGNDLRKQKTEDKAKHKKKLQELYEKEMENL